MEKCNTIINIHEIHPNGMANFWKICYLLGWLCQIMLTWKFKKIKIQRGDGNIKTGERWTLLQKTFSKYFLFIKYLFYCLPAICKMNLCHSVLTKDLSNLFQSAKYNWDLHQLQKYLNNIYSWTWICHKNKIILWETCNDTPDSDGYLRFMRNKGEIWSKLIS